MGSLAVDSGARGSPDYSAFATQYAHSRPSYPAELFAHLASLVSTRRLAWDCATGNGQAALGLVKYFDRVIATDVSAAQISRATAHSQIEYRVARSEQSGLGDQSVDLVTVASALHWFDLEAFYAEARRIIRPRGVLAAWTYHVGRVEPPFDRVFDRFYQEVVGPYFGAGARLADAHYEGISLPGEALEAPSFSVTATWRLDQMLAFIGSWSGTQEYIKERRQDPAAVIAQELERLWEGRERTRVIRWPLYLRISRL